MSSSGRANNRRAPRRRVSSDHQPAPRGSSSRNYRAQQARRPYPTREHPTREHATTRPEPAPRETPTQLQRNTMRRRIQWIVVGAIVIAVALIVRLGWVQVVWGPDLAEKAEAQRARVYVDPARRGTISDRDGRDLAYTMQARSLTVSPIQLRKELRQQQEYEVTIRGDEEARNRELDKRVGAILKDMSTGIPRMIKEHGNPTDEVDPKEILEKLKADTHYELLVRNVDPDIAVEIASTYHGVAADHQDIRQYPNGAIAENIIGKVSMDGQGQFGFEASGDSVLAGINGRSTEDVSTNGQVIPGTLRDQVPAVNGKNVTLTLDLDTQTFVQQKIEQAKANSGAHNASAVVLDAKTGEIIAMANTGTIDPNGDIAKQLETGRDFDNRAVSHPFEPGSVAKIITAAGIIEEGLSTPDEVLTVPGSIHMSGVTVRDAWQHGDLALTTTGIFGKSSNVGTLMLAQRLGEDKYADYLRRFGIGQPTGVELPNESAGLLPPREQWSGGTFANLPIGQGMSWTALQLASVYQTLANGGERIEPRIISKVQSADGSLEEQPAPARTRVVSEHTARTIVDMFRGVFQTDPTGLNSGTAAGNGVEGYQLAGKTGTAQQVDPDTGAYSNSDYWITFGGIAPADDPRFVIAVMLDAPERGPNPDGGGGASAAPVFHDIASWLLDRHNVPLSPPQEGQLILQHN